MTFSDSERVLGKEITEQVIAAVRDAFVVARSQPDGTGEQALTSLLVHALTAVLVTPQNWRGAAERVEACCSQISAVSAAAAAEYGSGKTPFAVN